MLDLTKKLWSERRFKSALGKYKGDRIRKLGRVFGIAGAVGIAGAAAMGSGEAQADELNADRFQQDEVSHEKREDVDIGVLDAQ